MITFYKYHGLGNDFILIDNRENKVRISPEIAKKLCHRFFGIGADGLILAETSSLADIKMIIYNSDGSRAGMCGNGLRCFAKFAYEKLGIKKASIGVETDSGVLITGIIEKDRTVEAIKVNMGRPIFENDRIPCTIEKNPILDHKVCIKKENYKITSLLMGVPHTVIFTDEIDDDSVVFNGKIIEASEIFPKKTNVNFVRIINPEEIILRTWERGAGYTYACGTGACASVIAGILNGLLHNNVLVHLRGGDLFINWPDRADVFMEGPAVEVYQGVLIME